MYFWITSWLDHINQFLLLKHLKCLSFKCHYYQYLWKSLFSTIGWRLTFLSVCFIRRPCWKLLYPMYLLFQIWQLYIYMSLPSVPPQYKWQDLKSLVTKSWKRLWHFTAIAKLVNLWWKGSFKTCIWRFVVIGIYNTSATPTTTYFANYVNLRTEEI